MHGDSSCGNSNCGGTSCVAVGDAYLAYLVPKILTSVTFTTRRAALIITFDEGSDVSKALYFVVAGGVAKHPYSSSTAYNHYSWLKTIENNQGLTCLANDCSASAMGDFFTTFLMPSYGAFHLRRGCSLTDLLTVTSNNWFSGSVTLGYTKSGSGNVNLSFDPSTISVPSGGSASANELYVASSVGYVTLTVTGTSGSYTNSYQVAVTVTTTGQCPAKPR